MGGCETVITKGFPERCQGALTLPLLTFPATDPMLRPEEGKAGQRSALCSISPGW